MHDCLVSGLVSTIAVMDHLFDVFNRNTRQRFDFHNWGVNLEKGRAVLVISIALVPVEQGAENAEEDNPVPLLFPRLVI